MVEPPQHPGCSAAAGVLIGGSNCQNEPVGPLGFYGWGLWYVGRDEVRNCFGAPDLDDEPSDGWDHRSAPR